MEKDVQLFLNSTHDGMIAVDKNGFITLFNTVAGKLLNKSPAEAIGKHVTAVVKNTRLPYVLETGQSELNRQQELEGVKIITNRMPVRDDNGNIIGAIAVFRDISDVISLAEEITNLKEMKIMLSAIINATQDAISVVDQNNRGILINPAYTRITGLTERDVIGKPPTVDIAEGESIHSKVIETKQPVKGAFIKIRPFNREVLVNAAPIIVDGELRGSVGVIHDITEITKLTAELKQAKELIRKLEAKYTFEDIKGHAPVLISAVDKAKKAAETSVTVLLMGESGTGKEIFAHAIHNASDRKFNQFIRVNCAALSESLFESELFGYEEGAFTGARKGGRKGLFEEANGGTIFLDEIGEMPVSSQSKLLRVLQERELVRVGGTKYIDFDVRIIAATNTDIEKAVHEGRFRSDLYFRLDMFPILIPPLRERKSDINELSDYILKKLNQQYGKNVQHISEEAIRELQEYEWPGNIRELENIIGRAIINMRTGEPIIQASHLPMFEKQTEKMKESEDCFGPDDTALSLNDVLEETEKKYLIAVMEQCSNNKTKAAKKLNISLRSLYYKLSKYGLL